MKQLKSSFGLLLQAGLMLALLNTNGKAQDSTKVKLGSRAGFYFSADICDKTSMDYLARFGYQVGVSYSKRLSSVFSLGTGMAFTRFAYQEDSKYYGWYFVIPKERNIYHHINYLEIPLFTQFTFGKSEKFKFDIKFGATVTALIKEGKEGIVKGEDINENLYEHKISNEHSYSLLGGENGARIHYSYIMFAGVLIKVSSKMYLTIHSSNRFYPSYGYSFTTYSAPYKSISTGLSVGISYKIG